MASVPEEYFYFEPGFDPNSITVPQLRSVLLKHNVQYPASAKKALLVDLFNQQVAPQGAKLLKAQSRTKRSTRGIEDVPSSQASTTTDDPEEDEDTLLPPPTVNRRTSRRTTRAATEETERAAPASRAKTPSRAVSAKHGRGSDLEPDERPATRRTRHSVTPAIQEERVEPATWHKYDHESPFSSENPFQSGSSPPAPDSTAVARERRRKTLGPVEQKEKRRSEVNRRKTVQPNVEQLDKGIVVPSRRTFEAPVPRMPEEDAPGEFEVVEAGEEFTPEEQLELVRERARTGLTDILPPRRHRQQPRAKNTLTMGAWAVICVVLAVLGPLWRQEKISLGFCGIGEPKRLTGVDVPEWATPILPECEECPPHAICYPNLVVQCEDDFVLKPHPLSLGGLIPLPPTCEPDSLKQRRINLVADKSVEVLQERRAQFECGDLMDKKGKPVDSPEVDEEDLKQEVAAKRRKGLSQDEFDDLFKSALGELVKRDEVVSNPDGTGKLRLSSTSLVKLPLSCAIRRQLRATLERYIRQLIGLILVTSLGFYARYSYTSNRAMEARAQQLASNVFDRLANHAALNIEEPGAYPEQGVAMNHLRDDILRTEFSASKRQKLWQRVQKKVEHNSNVRSAIRESRSGDVARMWEWIGPVELPLLEGGNGSGRRKSTRWSFGPSIKSSPPSDIKQEIKREFDNSGWDENRPIY